MLRAYIISTAITLVIFTINSLAIRARLKREGYKKKDSNASIFEVLQASIYLFIPILNIITALTVQFKDREVYEKVKASYTKMEG